jgi:phosphoribosylformylglycinamidine synthase
MRFGVVVFPGTWSDKDCLHVLGPVLGQETVSIWHQDTDLQGCDAVILPGGFSYGDYLRAGAIARFAPVMESIRDFADRGGLVLGICNGFQILLEAGLLPGAMLRNESLEFRCQWTNVRIENASTPFTGLCSPGQVLRIPISHGEGNYFAEDVALDALEASGGVLMRYCDDSGSLTTDANPNGSRRNIAGIVSPGRNVAAMMPHPERCAEAILGSEDGRLIFNSMIAALAGQRVAVG